MFVSVEWVCGRGCECEGMFVRCVCRDRVCVCVCVCVCLFLTRNFRYLVYNG